MLVANAEGGTVSIVDARRPRVLREIDILPDGPEPGLDRQPDAGAPRPADRRGGRRQELRPGPGRVAGRAHALRLARPPRRRGRVRHQDRASCCGRSPIPGLRSDHMTISDDGSRLYVSALTEDEVEVIDTERRAIVAHVPDRPVAARQPREPRRRAPLQRQHRQHRRARRRAARRPPAARRRTSSRSSTRRRSSRCARTTSSAASGRTCITHDERTMYAQLSEFHGVVEVRPRRGPDRCAGASSRSTTASPRTTTTSRRRTTASR